MRKEKALVFRFSSLRAEGEAIQKQERTRLLRRLTPSRNDAAIIFLALFSLPLSANADDAVNADNITRIVIHPVFEERNAIDEATGSSTYKLDSKAIDNLPQGAFTPIDQVLLRTPSVAQDSYGQVHIRGDHDDLQYQINGIILPEGVSGFGQTLDTHFAEKMDLLTGALPAQYGYRTAGIVDITTKSGKFDDGGRSSVMMGSNATMAGNQEFYGSKGNANYYFSGNYLQNDLGIESPTSAKKAIHDSSNQDKEFGYMEYGLTPQQKVSIIFGNATNHFQIPNNPNQPQNFSLNNVPNFASASLNETQLEHNTYLITALQGKTSNDLTYQFAVFSRYSSVLFNPDPAGDLIFNGIASTDYRSSFANGLQNDFSYKLNDAHTLRAGLTASYEQSDSKANSSVCPCCDAGGLQTSTTPFSIANNNTASAKLFGTYLQDEWKIGDKFTVNYGARFDAYSAFVNANQLSPRIGMIYDLTSTTTFHSGYARYFTPPDTELITAGTLNQFANSTGATPSTQSSPVKPERDNYFDAGISQKVGKSLTLGVDSYYKQARNLLDMGQFGQALIFAPFNYQKGWVRGIEFTSDYNHAGLSAYSNLALSKAMGKNVVSGQYNFSQDSLNYIQSKAVHLDHDQLITGSAGAAYSFDTITYSTDLIFGSGLRSGFANTQHLPFYTQVNLGMAHSFDLGVNYGLLESKLSINNLFDRVYEIRDGSGIGVFAPQYAPRRAIFLELSKSF